MKTKGSYKREKLIHQGLSARQYKETVQGIPKRWGTIMITSKDPKNFDSSNLSLVLIVSYFLDHKTVRSAILISLQYLFNDTIK